ncbi:MAG: FG-GAP-like repeat-containing protein, partial [Phycisphaerae bacterium]
MSPASASEAVSGSIVGRGTQVVGADLSADFIAVAGGDQHSLGLKTDGSVVAWGYNRYGQCDVPAPNTDFVDVAAGVGHSLGLRADGWIVAWGGNYEGQYDVAGPLPARGVDVPFTEHVISTTADGAFSVFATDVDGDGNTDVLSASIFDDKIAWYESDGGSPPAFTERVISTTADGAFSVFATDMDGDGDTDVLSAWYFDDKIAWYESDGGWPPSFTERVISTATNGPRSVFATDLDGDGDTDVLSASLLDDKIAWYESDGGSPPTFTESVISTTADGAYSVFATDVDGDGDTDVLSASTFDDKIAWYENTGPSIACGDGVVEGAEVCDDGFTDDCGTCNADC